MARETCVYCGAAISREALEEAASAARRVLQTGSLRALEGAARGEGRGRKARRYLVLDTAVTSEEVIADACSVSIWEARQWRIASRYRLLKVSTDPPEAPFEARLREKGLTVLVVDEDIVTRARQPLQVQSIDAGRVPAECTVRSDPDAPGRRYVLAERELALLISGPIQREKVQEFKTPKKVPTVRLEEALLVHLHVLGESRPFEIDPRRAIFEGPGLASAHMRTLELLRRLSATVVHDQGFKNLVPALAPGQDPLSELAAPKPGPNASANESKLVVLDNVAQFREYSAWRGSLPMVCYLPPRA